MAAVPKVGAAAPMLYYLRGTFFAIALLLVCITLFMIANLLSSDVQDNHASSERSVDLEEPFEQSTHDTAAS